MDRSCAPEATDILIHKFQTHVTAVKTVLQDCFRAHLVIYGAALLEERIVQCTFRCQEDVVDVLYLRMIDPGVGYTSTAKNGFRDFSHIQAKPTQIPLKL